MTQSPAPSALALASDHAGVALKSALAQHLSARGEPPLDFGTDGAESVDYPDFAAKLCEWVLAGENRRGVLICGSGIGMSMAANRMPGIRAALCRSGLEAELARKHNDANVLCLGERITGVEMAKDCVNRFMDTAFEGGRHKQRLEKMG